MTRAAVARRAAKHPMVVLLGVVMLAVLAVVSLFVGAVDVGVGDALSDPEVRSLLFTSRVPRTVALILSGAAMSVAGLIMQMVTQNKFVEPSTSGTLQSASLGLLLALWLWPGAPILLRMLISTVTAMIGTAVFMTVLSRVGWRDVMLVPLIGIMLGAVLGAFTMYIALNLDMVQALISWESGSFAGVLKGRYELLWLLAVLVIVAYACADRFSVAGLGRDMATNVRLDYRTTVFVGTGIVALVTGVIVSVVGFMPFLGLIVPNAVSLVIGDDVRRALPRVCLVGAALAIVCDIVARIVVQPFEIPVSTVLGVVGTLFFLVLITRRGVTRAS